MRKFLVGILYLLSAGSLILGFHRLWFYDSGGILGSGAVNAWVGADAYNFIINSNQAAAYFCAAIVFSIWASTLSLTDSVQAVIEKDAGQTKAPPNDGEDV